MFPNTNHVIIITIMSLLLPPNPTLAQILPHPKYQGRRAIELIACRHLESLSTDLLNEPRLKLLLWNLVFGVLEKQIEGCLISLPKGAWLTLEGEQQQQMLAVKWGFQPLNHNKQRCKMFSSTPSSG